MLSRGPFHKEVRRILSITLSLSSSVISNSTPRRVNRMQDVTIFKLGQQAYFKFLNVDLGKTIKPKLRKVLWLRPLLSGHGGSLLRAFAARDYSHLLRDVFSHEINVSLFSGCIVTSKSEYVPRDLIVQQSNSTNKYF